MRQQTFFEPDPQDVPLATRMRPRELEEFAGQEHLLGEGKVLRQLIDQDRVSSMIFGARRELGKRRWPGLSPGGQKQISSISAR